MKKQSKKYFVQMYRPETGSRITFPVESFNVFEAVKVAEEGMINWNLVKVKREFSEKHENQAEE